MSVFLRLILSLYNLLLIALGLFCLSLSFNYGVTSEEIVRFLSNIPNRWILGLGGCGMVLLGLVLLLAGLKSEKPRYAIISDAPDGKVTITIPAIQQMILRSARSVEGIREARTEVRKAKKGLLIDLFILTNYDCSLPEVTGEAKERIRKHLEEMAGLRVSEVRVTVDELPARPVVR